jgi:hypothetical protein
VELIYAVKGGYIDKFLKTTVILIIPVALAIGINFASLYTTWEYGKYSIRGKSDLTTADKKVSSGLDKNYITYWSYGVDETFNMLIPDYKGGSSKPFDRDSETVKALRQNNASDAANQLGKYWGTQPGTDGPHYIGAIVFFLFILGLLLVKGPEKWWLLSATILSMMLAWGKNFMPLSDLFINFFPGYNKFRAVTMILVIAEFCMPLLGFLALRDIFNGKLNRDEVLKNLKIAAAITGGFTLLVLIIPGIAGSFLSPYEAGYPNWLKTTLVTDRKALLRMDSFRSLIFIVLALGVLLAYLNNKLKTNQSIVILGILILIDLWVVDKRYLNSDRFDRSTGMSNVFVPTTADKFIMDDPAENRVLNLTVSTFNDNSPTSYFHHSIGGYHGAKMKRYQELIDSVLNGNIELMRFTAGNSKTIEEFQTVFSKTHALNMLNTRYVIFNPESAPLVNDKALGNAWFVENPVVVQNANEELSSVSNFDPANQAFVDKKFSSYIKKSSYPSLPGDTIKLTSYLPNELVYNYTASDEKLILFSEIYYPAGWKCFIDGKGTEYFRADYVLRAMIAPAGSHEIRFKFEPASYINGNKISLASSIILILIILGYFGAGIYKRVTEKA